MSFRFLHSVGPQLDGQLHDTPQYLGDVSRLAWDNLVTAAFEAEVDFILIQGELLRSSSSPEADFRPGKADSLSINRSTSSLEAENWSGKRDLIPGLELLEGIPVFVTDPSPGMDWPTGIEVLRGGVPVEVTRSGRVVCTLCPEYARIENQQVLLQRPSKDQRNQSIFVAVAAEEEHLRHSISLTQLGQSSHAYFAFAEESSFSPGNRIHSPGIAQPLRSSTRGGGEVSVVTIAPPRDPGIRQIPVAPVRFFSIELHLSKGDALRTACQKALSKIPKTSADQYWIVTWLVRGEVMESAGGSLWESVRNPSFDRVSSNQKPSGTESWSFQLDGVKVLSQGFFLDRSPSELSEDSLAGQYLELVDSLCEGDRNDSGLVRSLARHWGISQLASGV